MATVDSALPAPPQSNEPNGVPTGSDVQPAIGRVLLQMAIVASVLIGLGVQFTTYLNHDIGWILYSAKWLLHGASFGKEIIAVNPPLIWYLSAPITAIADVAGLQAATAFRLVIAAVAMITLWTNSHRWLPPALARSSWRTAFLAVGCFVLFVDSQRDFGQREYLTFLFTLPYVFLVAARLQHNALQPTVGGSFAIGVLAGIGVAFKPHLLAVPFCIELTAWLRNRRVRQLLRPEVAGGAVAIVLYGVAVLTCFPAYTDEWIPVFRQLYWGFENSWFYVFWKMRLELILLAATGMMLWRSQTRPLSRLLFAQAIGFAIACMAQKKAYSYHVFPLRATLCLLLLALAFDFAGERIANLRGRKLAAVGLLGLFLLTTSLSRGFAWYSLHGQLLAGEVYERVDSKVPPRLTPYQVQTQLIALLNRYSSDDRFLALSTHPHPGFPTALYVAPDWCSHTNSRIFLPAIAKLRELHDDSLADQLSLAEQLERKLTLDDLRQQPAVVLLDAAPIKHALGRMPFDMLSFYLEEQQFAAEWSRYREAAPIGPYRVFVRQSDDTIARRN